MTSTLASLITALGLLHLVALVGEGQPGAKVHRLGYLGPGPAPFFMEPFAEEMRARGWVEGQHFTWERRFTGADPNAATALARELVDLQVDVIVTGITGNALAAHRASTRIPIVMLSSGYPVEAGLAKSLRMPGGNVTGNATYVDGKVFGKYLEFLRILSPRLTRLGVLWDYVPPAATTQEAALALSELNRAARALRITVKLREVRGKSDVDHALAGFAKDRVDALFVTSGPVHADPETAESIIASARRQRMPTMSDFAGGFFAHGGLLADHRVNGPSSDLPTRYSGQEIERREMALKALRTLTRRRPATHLRAQRALALAVPLGVEDAIRRRQSAFDRV